MMDSEAEEQMDQSTLEDDDRLLNNLFSTYWPSPGDFHCLKCVDVYYQRLIKIRDENAAFYGSDAQGPGASTNTASQERISAVVDSVQAQVAAETKKDVSSPQENDSPIVKKREGEPQPGEERAAAPEKRSTEATVKEMPRKGKRIPPPPKSQDRISVSCVDDSKAPPVSVTNDAQDRSEAGHDISKDNEEPEFQRPRVPREKQVWLPPRSVRWGGRRSQFTEDEHKRYVGSLCNLQNVGKFRFEENKAEYKTMKERLKKETEKFNEYVAQQSRGCLVKNSNFLPRAVSNYLFHCLETKSSIIQSLPSQFTMKGIHCITMPIQDPPVLEFSKHLLDVGKAGRIVMPDLKRKATVPLDSADKIASKYPFSEKAKEGLLWSDPNVQTLTSKYGPDIITSASALRALMLWRGPYLCNDCELPVTVTPVYIEGRRQKIVTISKPLPPRVLTIRQQFGVLAKYALKTQMIAMKYDVEKARAYSSAGVQHETESTEPSCELFGDYDPDSVECFAAGQAAPSMSNMNVDSADSNDETGTNALCIDEEMPLNSSFESAAADGHAFSSQIDSAETSGDGHTGKALTDTEDSADESQLRQLRSRSMSVSSRIHTPAAKRARFMDTSDQTCQAEAKRAADGESVSGGNDPTVSKDLSSPTNNDSESPRRPLRQRWLSGSGSKAAGGDQKTEEVKTQGEKASNPDGGDILSGILKRMDATAPAKTFTGFNLQNDTWYPGESPAVEDASEYCAPTKAGCMRQYSMWNLKNIPILLRSNVDGIGSRVAKEQRRDYIRANISAKVEYQPNFGAEKQTDEEVAYDWLTAFLKRADLHYRGRIRYNPDHDILAIDTLTRQNHLRLQQLGIVPQQMIMNGMRRLHVLLGELKNLNPGTYLLKIKASDPYVYTILQPMSQVANSCLSFVSKPEIDLAHSYDGSNWLRTERCSTFDQCWREIDPDVLFQWHKVLKRIPTTFDPRQENEEPKLDVDTKKANRNWRKKKGKKGAGKRAPTANKQDTQIGDDE